MGGQVDWWLTYSSIVWCTHNVSLYSILGVGGETPTLSLELSGPEHLDGMALIPRNLLIII